MILPGTGRGTIGRRANGGGGASLHKPTVYHARKLRREMSSPEALLWGRLRGAKLGFKVRRQHPIGPYVADFFIADSARDHYMRERGYRVLRILARDVMRNLEGVLVFIVKQVASPLHHPSGGPSPHAGEER